MSGLILNSCVCAEQPFFFLWYLCKHKILQKLKGKWAFHSYTFKIFFCLVRLICWIFPKTVCRGFYCTWLFLWFQEICYALVHDYLKLLWGYKIRGSHGDVHEQYCSVGCDAVCSYQKTHCHSPENSKPPHQCEDLKYHVLLLSGDTVKLNVLCFRMWLSHSWCDGWPQCMWHQDRTVRLQAFGNITTMWHLQSWHLQSCGKQFVWLQW